MRKPEEIETTQSTIGVDIINNNNKNSSSLPIDTYNNNINTIYTTLPTNPIPITRVISTDNDNNSTPSNNNSSNSIGYVAWDFAGQLEYSTLHPVTNQLYHEVVHLPIYLCVYLFNFNQLFHVFSNL